MDKRTLFDQFHRVESRISSVSEDLQEIQQKLTELIEENIQLKHRVKALRDERNAEI